LPRYEIAGLTRAFGGVRAIDDIHFAAEPGEFLVILGPTGAGKTTLLRTVAGLERADAGRLLADGEDISNLPPAARDMAMVFQNFSLYPRLTVYENLAFPLRPRWRRMSRAQIDQRVVWAAELLGISSKLDQRPTQLSGGQQQRVAIGRAIVREPKLFLLDEPLASLDAKLREQMTIELHRLQRRLRVTMLYVTHDQIEAMSLADRIVVLDAGKVLQIGTPDDVYRRPASPRVAQMLGSPPINLLSGDEAAALGLPSAKTVGIRPEHLAIEPIADGGAVATVVEHLGPVTVVVLAFKNLKLRCTCHPAADVRVGAHFRIIAKPADLLLWDQ
jgi:multiple sugar transport system ATP-binding protein